MQEIKIGTKWTPKQVAAMLEISNSTLTKWTTEFDIKPDWTQEGEKGQRRYTKENIEDLFQIKDLVQVQKLSWEQAKDVLSGNSPDILVEEMNTKLKNEITKLTETVLEQRQEMREAQQRHEDLLKAVLQRMDQAVEDAVQKAIAPVVEERELYKKMYLESKEDKEEYKAIVENSLGEMKEEMKEELKTQLANDRDALLLETSKMLMKERKNEYEKAREVPKQQSFFQRLFKKES